MKELKQVSEGLKAQLLAEPEADIKLKAGPYRLDSCSTAADIKFLVEIFKKLPPSVIQARFQHDLDAKRFQGLLESKNLQTLVLSEKTDSIQAVLGWGDVYESGGSANISYLVVPEYQRRGWGEFIIDCLMLYSRKHLKKWFCEANVAIDNYASKHIMRKYLKRFGGRTQYEAGEEVFFINLDKIPS